jgi:hypothetical protein
MTPAKNFDIPLTLYRYNEGPKGELVSEQRVVHSQREYDKAVAEGFGERYRHQSYPRMVYDPQTNQPKKVHSAEEEQAAFDEGYLAKKNPTVAKEEKPAEAAPEAPALLDRMARIEDAVLKALEIGNSLAQLHARLDALEAPKSSKTKTTKE